MTRLIKNIGFLVCMLAFAGASQASLLLEEAGNISYRMSKRIRNVPVRNLPLYISKNHISTAPLSTSRILLSSKEEIRQIEEVENRDERLERIENNCVPTLCTLAKFTEDEALENHTNRIFKLLKRYDLHHHQENMSDIVPIYKALVNTYANFRSQLENHNISEIMETNHALGLKISNIQAAWREKSNSKEEAVEPQQFIENSVHYIQDYMNSISSNESLLKELRFCH